MSTVFICCELASGCEASQVVSALGSRVEAPRCYAPEILEPIPRDLARVALGVDKTQPFFGADIWHLYELSWLNASNVPVSYIGTLTIPCDTPNLVESKSLKLYLNSLNFRSFDSHTAAVAQITTDVSHVVAGPIMLTLDSVTSLSGITNEPEGTCIDTMSAFSALTSDRCLHLRIDPRRQTEETLISHLLRSLCPVTGQPDWASLVVRYRGAEIDRGGLLNYVLSYREHQEFHEQCLERIFLDISAYCAPDSLAIAAFYQRRGGIDITPWRTSNNDIFVPTTRMARQ